MTINNISQHNPLKFEPFLEKLRCEISARKSNKGKKLVVSFLEEFLINLTPHCLETLLHFLKNMEKMQNNEKNNLLGIENIFSKSRSAFTFLNKTGHGLKIWFTEKREDLWVLENNAEKFLEIEFY